MSRVEVRERERDSPERARSLLTVRAAISSARSSDAPCSRWLSLMCSYWRARLVPGLTPLCGIVTSFGVCGFTPPAASRERAVLAGVLLDAGGRHQHDADNDGNRAEDGDRDADP